MWRYVGMTDIEINLGYIIILIWFAWHRKGSAEGWFESGKVSSHCTTDNTVCDKLYRFQVINKDSTQGLKRHSLRIAYVWVMQKLITF